MDYKRILQKSLVPSSLLISLVCFAVFTPVDSRGGGSGRTDAADPWKATELISPVDAAKELTKTGADKPLILYVGFNMLYKMAHIPGSQDCGPASSPAGLEKLKSCAQRIPRNKEVILYCGCCPWDHCPNVRPAFEALKKMGFTRLRLIEIPRDFGHDWIEKGLPTEKG